MADWSIDVENPPDPTAAAVADAILTDPRFTLLVQQACEAAIANKFSGYDARGRVLNLLLIKMREAAHIAPPESA